MNQPLRMKFTTVSLKYQHFGLPLRFPSAAWNIHVFDHYPQVMQLLTIFQAYMVLGGCFFFSFCLFVCFFNTDFLPYRWALVFINFIANTKNSTMSLPYLLSKLHRHYMISLSKLLCLRVLWQMIRLLFCHNLLLYLPLITRLFTASTYFISNNFCLRFITVFFSKPYKYILRNVTRSLRFCKQRGYHCNYYLCFSFVCIIFPFMAIISF